MIPKFTILILVLFSVSCLVTSDIKQPPKPPTDLWQVYDQALKQAKYVDLTHTITPTIPVWKGFGPSKFGRTIDPVSKRPYSWEKDGYEATQYFLSTDQLGTQLDPPAHWAPEYPAIDELPATFAVRDRKSTL